MHYPRIHIVTTRELEPVLIEKAALAGIQIDLLPLITTVMLHTKPLEQKIDQLAGSALPVIFTSLNAAKAVTALLKQKPDWQIFTIGTATKEYVCSYFGAESIVAVADNASGLAEKIIPSGVERLVYFCGNKRREELPEKLCEAGLQLEEVVVYHTTYTAIRTGTGYEGILFFSPGAADSFFAVNSVNQATVLFAIGNTTAAALLAYTHNKIVVSEVPSADMLVQKTIAYFDNLNIFHDRTQE